MSEVIRVLAVVAVIGYVIGRQLMGEPLRGKRVVLLPVILAIAGAADLGAHGRHVEPADVAWLVISGLIAGTIGLLQGRMMRLECRNGALWGRMPVRGLWLWAVLVASRLIITVIALAVGAKVAAPARRSSCCSGDITASPTQLVARTRILRYDTHLQCRREQNRCTLSLCGSHFCWLWRCAHRRKGSSR